jgi:integrase
METRRLVRHMGFVTGKAPTTPQMQVAWAYLVANHTAMRAGEVLGLKRSSVNLTTRVATLQSHKTLERDGVRFVPFTRKAARVLAVLDAAARLAGRDEYFSISGQSLDVLFRKVRDRLLIDNLHFHDSRAGALTRLSRRMDVLRLSRISGHRDLNQLLSAYYRETAADVAASI